MQFVEPVSGHVLVQTVLLGLIQIISAATAHGLVIILASNVSSFLRARGKALVAIQRYVFSTVLAGLAVKLALEKRHA